MDDTGQPPGVGQKQPPAVTPDMTGDGPETLPRRMRTYEEIVADERKCRNILTVTLNKIVKYVDGKEDRPPSLNMEDVGELFFVIVKLDVSDCVGLSLNTQRYDTKAINLKPS